jgi:hypothetical protein
MQDLRSTRRLIQKWHRREKATLDHLVSSIANTAATSGRVHPAVTSSGLIVEDQIRKAWQPNSGGGLPIF